MSFLSPDKNNKLLTMYHKSAKIMLPLTVVSYVSHKYNLEPYNNALLVPNVLSMSYHSYVSTSCVISDYIKIPKLETISRFINLKSHSLATIGFIYYIVKNNKKDV